MCAVSNTERQLKKLNNDLLELKGKVSNMERLLVKVFDRLTGEESEARS